MFYVVQVHVNNDFLFSIPRDKYLIWNTEKTSTRDPEVQISPWPRAPPLTPASPDTKLYCQIWHFFFVSCWKKKSNAVFLSSPLSPATWWSSPIIPITLMWINKLITSSRRQWLMVSVCQTVRTCLAWATLPFLPSATFNSSLSINRLRYYTFSLILVCTFILKLLQQTLLVQYDNWQLDLCCSTSNAQQPTYVHVACFV